MSFRTGWHKSVVNRKLLIDVTDTAAIGWKIETSTKHNIYHASFKLISIFDTTGGIQIVLPILKLFAFDAYFLCCSLIIFSWLISFIVDPPSTTKRKMIKNKADHDEMIESKRVMTNSETRLKRVIEVAVCRYCGYCFWSDVITSDVWILINCFVTRDNIMKQLTAIHQ